MDRLTFEYLNPLLRYDPETGHIYWRQSRGRLAKAGDVAGHITKLGYRRLLVGGRSVLAHRVAWLLHYGTWPQGDVDHLNGVRDDNRISNLRDVSHAVNSQNIRTPNSRNSSGVLGVGPHHGRWRARLRLAGKLYLLGTFDTVAEAHAAYLSAKRVMHVGNTL